MAKSRRRKRNRASGHGHRVARAHNRRRRNRGGYRPRHRRRNTVIMRAAPRRRHRRSRNPFASTISLSRPAGIITAAAGVLVGVAATKFIVGLLPPSITSNTIYATVAAFGAAAVEWWLFSLVSPEFGAAAGLGGIAEAGSIALTNFMPSLSGVALSGRLGDFVPGRFVVPQNPVLDAATGLPSAQRSAVSAYPKPYAVAA